VIASRPTPNRGNLVVGPIRLPVQNRCQHPRPFADAEILRTHRQNPASAPFTLLDILDATMDELIEPPRPQPRLGAAGKKPVGAQTGIGDLRPKRARIHGVD
jgi:hypothetical protein